MGALRFGMRWNAWEMEDIARGVARGVARHVLLLGSRANGARLRRRSRGGRALGKLGGVRSNRWLCRIPKTQTWVLTMNTRGRGGANERGQDGAVAAGRGRPLRSRARAARGRSGAWLYPKPNTG